MKIPFDIKYKDLIMSGEYKVVTRAGHPARIICWDANTCGTPIVAIVGGTASNFGLNGMASLSGQLNIDLFVETPEPDLKESLHEVVCSAINDEKKTYKLREFYSKKLIPYLDYLESCRRVVEGIPSSLPSIVENK